MPIKKRDYNKFLLDELLEVASSAGRDRIAGSGAATAERMPKRSKAR